MDKTVDVIIIGAGLTGLTTAYYLQKTGKKVLVIEKENRTGGVMKTTHTDEFIFETGPISGSMGSVEIAELFEDLEGTCTLETANNSSKQRWIMKNKRWQVLPSGIGSGLTTPLFSWYDKLRILGEPFRKPGRDPHESVANLVKRRMGDSYLNYAVDPFISGIYAGDPEKLITKYALPKLYNLEQDYGSFIGGSIKKAKERTERDKKATKEVFTTQGGIQNLIDALTNAIGENNILLGQDTCTTSAKANNEYITTVSKQVVKSTHVVSTIGSYAIANVFPFISKEKLDIINQLEYAKVSQVVLGYHKWTGKKLDAFGGLIPSSEKRDTLGILFSSSIFSHRAPKEGALMTVFIGGVKHPDFIDKSDEELTAMALYEVKETLFNSELPDMIKVVRYPRAIPQYDIRSGKRFTTIKEIENQYKGLYLAGNMRDGIGMSDRVKQAKRIADKISKVTI